MKRHFLRTLLKFLLVVIGFGVLILALSLYLKTYSEAVVFKSPCVTTGKDKAMIAMAQKELENLKLSGAYLISQNGDILAKAFCGTSDPSSRAEVTNKTQFNIGSMTKQFTGYLLLELTREGKVKLAEPLSAYIPELKNNDLGKVTIEQLMLMRSGIPYLLSYKDFLSIQLSKHIWTEQEMISTIGKSKLDFLPGTQFSYSNLGYSLLGIVIGRADHSTWSQSLRKRIFEPLKMTNSTTEGENPERPEGLAVGLLPFTFLSKNFFLALPHWNYSMIVGAGGIVSTVDDLNLWNQFLSERSKRDSEWANAYFSKGPPSEEHYSYGWFRSEISLGDSTKIETINHGGEDPGYCSSVTRLSSHNAFVIITTNSDYCIFKEGAFRPFTKSMVEALVERMKAAGD